MNIDQLLYLQKLDEYKSFAAVSELVHLTPQALSISIKRLEEELNVTLLIRTSKGVVLTEKGKKLIEISTRFLEDLQEFSTQKEIVPIQGTISFLVSHDEYGSPLLPILCELQHHYPQANFFSTKYSRDIILDKLLKQEATFAFIYRQIVDDCLINFPEEELDFIPLFKRDMICLVPKSFPIASYKKLSIKTLKDFPIIIYHPRNSNNYSMENILKLFFQPQNVIYVENASLVNYMVASGIGISFTLPTPYKRLNNALSSIEQDTIAIMFLKEKIECEYGIVYHPTYSFSLSENNFIQFVKQYTEVNQVCDYNSIL